MARQVEDAEAQEVAQPQEHAPPQEDALSERRPWLLLTVPGMVAAAWAYAGTLGYGLLVDARFLISDNHWLRSWSDAAPNLTHDYFWSSSGNTIPYWRPLTKLSWLAEQILGGGEAWPFHAVQVSWWLLAASGAAVLAVELGALPLWAALAGAALALHPAAVEPVSLVMARSDVVAVAGSLWTLAFFARWSRSKQVRWLVACHGALLVALASKEASVALGPLLTLWLWRDLPPQQREKRWWLAVVPAWVLTAGYLAARRSVLGERPGADLGVDGVRIAGALGRYAMGLLPGRLETGVMNLPRELAMAPATWVPALAAAVLCSVWLLRAWRQRQPDWVILLWLAASMAPVLLIQDLNVPGVADKIPLADRWILPAAAALQVLLAVALSRLTSPRVSRAALALTGLWLLARAGLVADDHAAYASESAMLDLEDRQLLDVDPRYRSAEDLCRFATRAMVRAGQQQNSAEVLALSAAMTPECRDQPEPRFNLLAATVALGQMAKAVEVGRGLLVHPPADRRFAGPLRALLGQALVAQGQCQQARPLLLQAWRLGAGDCRVAALLGRCAQEAGEGQAAAQHFEAAAACVDGQPGSPPGLGAQLRAMGRSAAGLR